MPAALANEILEFNHSHDRNLFKAALEVVAQMRKVRPVFLERQPREERYAAMAASLSRPALAGTADNLLRNWLLKKQTALLIDFLDALGLKHDKGVIEDLPKSVEDAVLTSAVETLLARHPAGVVSVYLHSFNVMNAESWSNLDAILQQERRLKLERGS